MKQILEHQTSQPQARTARLNVGDGRSEVFGFWLTSVEACAYVGSRSLNAWYMWRKRHGIATDRMGRVSRRDLDLALRVPRKRRAMAARSLDNLKVRHAAQDAANRSAERTTECLEVRDVVGIGAASV